MNITRLVAPRGVHLIVKEEVFGVGLIWIDLDILILSRLVIMTRLLCFLVAHERVSEWSCQPHVLAGRNEWPV